MIKRGIDNTKADWWVHFFPFEHKVFSYYVSDMKEWISENNPAILPGKSKDGTVTGRGYLIPRNLPFIIPVSAPDEIVRYFKWEEGTDREVGLLWGEKAIRWMIIRNALRIPYFTVKPIRSKGDQITLGDFGIQFHMPEVVVMEVKTEKVKSKNLFVQTHEQGHKIHQNKVNGKVVTHVTAAPDFQ